MTSSSSTETSSSSASAASSLPSPTLPIAPKNPSVSYSDLLLTCLHLLLSAVSTSESKHTAKALRHLRQLRSSMRPRVLCDFIDQLLLHPHMLKPLSPSKGKDGDGSVSDETAKSAADDSKDVSMEKEGEAKSVAALVGSSVYKGAGGRVSWLTGAASPSIGIDLVTLAYEALKPFVQDDDIEAARQETAAGVAQENGDVDMALEGDKQELKDVKATVNPPSKPGTVPSSASSSAGTYSASSTTSSSSTFLSSSSSSSSSMAGSPPKTGWLLSVHGSGGLTDFEVCVPEHRFVPCLAEAESFLVLLAVVALVDKKKYDKSMEVCDILTTRVQAVNRRSLDALTARAFFYKSLSYERGGELRNIRPALMCGLRSSTLHRDHMTCATVLNLLLRNFLHYRLYDLALKLVSKSVYPETLRSNAQFARYLYYLGRIHAVQMEYAEAHLKLLQAGRKAPSAVGKGFKLQTTKMSIVVELLMGEIPDRQMFNQKDLRTELVPYQQIVQAVRCGDMTAFHDIMGKYKNVFEKDGTLFLIRRLHHNVLRAGLRMVNVSYSNISLGNIASKLSLDSVADAEAIVSKSIMDKVIDATINHDDGTVTSKPHVDVYSSGEPIKVLHKRIAFCLQLHADAIKAMQYPEPEENKTEEAEARRQRHMEEMARAEDDELNGDDMDLL